MVKTNKVIILIILHIYNTIILHIYYITYIFIIVRSGGRA